jgi:hypothetical protein
LTKLATIDEVSRVAMETLCRESVVAHLAVGIWAGLAHSSYQRKTALATQALIFVAEETPNIGRNALTAESTVEVVARFTLDTL